MTMEVGDYQWPGLSLKPQLYSESLASVDVKEAYRRIEEKLSEKFGVSALLMPSGRSAISHLLQFSGIGRGSAVFAPLWSSHCVWEALGRWSCPTSELSPSTQGILVVHKWGYISRLSGSYPHAFLVDDSVDSFLLDGRNLFSSGGRFEIISLPKVIGSYSGGVIFTRDRSFESWIKERRFARPELARFQSRLRHQEISGNRDLHSSWAAGEALNAALDFNALSDIDQRLEGWESARDCILRRLELLSRTFRNRFLSPSEGRLPCVYKVLLSEALPLEGTPVMIRSASISGIVEKPDFQKHALIPLHFGASEELFQAIYGYFRTS